MCNSRVLPDSRRQWVLIDFDHATRIGQGFQGRHPLRETGATASPATDYYYMGHLLRDWRVAVLSDQLQGLAADLCSPDLAKRAAAFAQLLLIRQ